MAAASARPVEPRPVRVPRGAAVILFVAVLAAACSREAPPRPSAPPGAKVVRFRSTDGVSLEGTLSGRGPTGVILSHQYNADQSSWFPFAGRLAAAGYHVLTYDFRGYCPGGEAGCSSGKKDVAAAPEDLTGAIRFLRAQGVQQLFLIGASMGGTASLQVAPAELGRADGIITLSAPVAFEGLDANLGVLAGLRSPKLFIAGKDDPAGAAAAAQTFYARSAPRKQLLILPTDQHGAFILSVPGVGGKAEQAIMGFLDTYRKAP